MTQPPIPPDPKLIAVNQRRTAFLLDLAADSLTDALHLHACCGVTQWLESTRDYLAQLAQRLRERARQADNPPYLPPDAPLELL